MLANDAMVLDAGIAEDTVVSVAFKPNKVICSNKIAIAGLGGIIDSELSTTSKVQSQLVKVLSKIATHWPSGEVMVLEVMSEMRLGTQAPDQ